jgi:tetratricopeptide (TPR) repeat protein
MTRLGKTAFKIQLKKGEKMNKTDLITEISNLPKIDEAITPTAETVAANLRAFAKDAKYLAPGSNKMIANSANLRYVQPNYQPFIHGTKNKPADPLIVLSKSPPGRTSKLRLKKTSEMIKAIVFNRDGAVDRFDGKKTILELITKVADDLISENEETPPNMNCKSEDLVLSQSEKEVKKGIHFCEKKDYQTAISCFSEAIRLDPKNAKAYIIRGKYNERLGKFDEANRDYSEAIRLDPKDVYTYIIRGLTYKKLGKYDEAIRDNSEAIRLDPKDVLAYNNRGLTYEKLGKFDEAISDYSEAIRLDPEGAYAYYNRGNAYKRLGKFDEAISDYSEGIRLDPEDDCAYIIRGNAYKDFGKFEEAIRDYSEAIRLDPEDAEYYINRGNTYKRLGKFDEANRDYSEATKIDPERGNNAKI